MRTQNTLLAVIAVAAVVTAVATVGPLVTNSEIYKRVRDNWEQETQIENARRARAAKEAAANKPKSGRMPDDVDAANSFINGMKDGKPKSVDDWVTFFDELERARLRKGR